MTVKASRASRGTVVQLARPTLRETLGRLAPGTPLRDGLERILRGRTGGLIVLGYDDSVDAICDGGFSLDVRYAPQRLRERIRLRWRPSRTPLPIRDRPRWWSRRRLPGPRQGLAAAP